MSTKAGRPGARGRRAQLSCAAIVALALALTGCGGRQRPAQPAPYVQTTVASHGSIFPAQALAGIIAPFENVAIQSTLSEPADSVYVQEGDFVSKGQVLARLNTADLEAQLAADNATVTSNQANTTHTVYQGALNISQGNDAVVAARAGVTQAQANLRRDEADLNRFEDLLSKGFISAQQVSQSQATVRDDQAAVNTAQSQLAAAIASAQANGMGINHPGLQQSSVEQSQAQVQVAAAQADQVRVQISKATITSPIDGVVVNRNLNPGEYPGNRQIFTIQQVNPIYAILHGSGQQVANVQSGAYATIVSSDQIGVRRTGKVVGVLNEIAPGSTDFQVKVLLENPGQTLRPGMAVQGHVALPAVQGIRVPSTAFTDDNHVSLDIVLADDTVKTVPVTEIASDGTTSVVTGIQAGMRVVNNGQSSVGDGEKVSYNGEPNAGGADSSDQGAGANGATPNGGAQNGAAPGGAPGGGGRHHRHAQSGGAGGAGSGGGGTSQ